MLVCTAKDCLRPALWQPVFIALPAKHWGDAEHRIAMGIGFCDAHRAGATVDALFSYRARQAMDVQFVGRNLPLPDWNRSRIECVRIKPGVKSMAVFAVYENPADYPGKFVVRKWISDRASTVEPGEVIAIEDTIDAARAKIPQTHIRLPRQPSDDPAIVEAWV